MVRNCVWMVLDVLGTLYFGKPIAVKWFLAFLSRNLCFYWMVYPSLMPLFHGFYSNTMLFQLFVTWNIYSEFVLGMSIDMEFHIDICIVYIDIKSIYQFRAFEFSKYFGECSLKHWILPLFVLVLKLVTLIYKLQCQVACSFNILNCLKYCILLLFSLRKCHG
jgi:hypothetical protein